MTQSRLELTPLNFLRRCASTLGERPAVVHGERLNYAELEERCNRLATRCAPRASSAHERVAMLCPTARRCSRRISPSRRPAACSWRSTPVSRAPRSLHPRALRRAHAARRPRARALVEAVGSTASSLRVEDTRRGGRPVRGAARRRLARAARALARGRGGADRDQLHVRHDRPAQGRRSTPTAAPTCNALGVALETGLAPDTRLPVDAADVPLQRLVLHLGVTAVGGTHVCLRRVDPERIWELLDDEGVTHYCGAPTVLIAHRRPPDARTALEQRVTVPRRRAAVADDDRADARAQHPPVHVYGLTETYGPITVCSLAAGVGRAAGRGAGARCTRARAWPTRRRPRARGRRGDAATCPPTARRWARWSCAATT